MKEKMTPAEQANEAEFYFKLNDSLENAVLPIDGKEIEIPHGTAKPLIDLYQISSKAKWVKMRFARSRKTYIASLDEFIARVKRAFFSKADRDSARTKQNDLAKMILMAIQAQEGEDNTSNHQLAPKIEIVWNDDSTIDEKMLEDVCRHAWSILESGSWNSAIEYKITDQRLSRSVYDSLVRPFKQDGTQCKDGEFVVIEKPFRACFYNSGELIPMTTTQIWHRAIDPIAWFGKLVARKPSGDASYDDEDVELDLDPSSGSAAMLKR